MDRKVTLSFDQSVIERAKKFAAENGISLSRLTEFIYDKITAEPKKYKSLEEIEIADFIYELAEKSPAYKSTSSVDKKEFYESRK
jgi:hypothetical protein